MSNWNFLNAHRLRHGPLGSDESFGCNGAFSFPVRGEARRVFCIASDGMGFKHVSVSFGNGNLKPPSWAVMSQVKDLFWDDEDWVVQYHPPKSEHVNNHPGCLHLWQCIDGREMPHPPSILVGFKGLNLAEAQLASEVLL